MNIYRLGLLLFVASALLSGGCSSPMMAPMESKSPVYTGISNDPQTSLDTLEKAKVCCTRIEDIPFQELSTDADQYVEVNADSPAFVFATGKSFFKAYKIPNNVHQIKIEVASVARETVFVPTVLFLDDQFHVTRALGSGSFKYVQAQMLRPDRLQAVFEIERTPGAEEHNETYFVVFTTDADLTGETQLVSPAKAYAKVRGLVEPNLPDPIAQHAATGVFLLAVKDVEVVVERPESYLSGAQTTQRYLDPSSAQQAAATTPAGHAPIAVAPVAVTPQPKAHVAPAAAPARTSKPAEATPSAPKGMLKETETYYNSLIRKAVHANDIGKASRLTKEAKRAGSATAEAAFAAALKAASPRTEGPAMLQETQAYYNGLISKAVAQQDLQKAWRLVQEAERAGSGSARDAFLRALRK